MAFVKVSTSKTLTGHFRKEKAWELISDYTRYPDIMENVDAVTIHERNGNEGISEWFVTIEEAPLTWKEKDCFDNDNYEITFKSIAGDFDNINGRWKIENHNHEGISIHFTIDYNLGIPVIEEVLGHILEEKMKSNMETMITSVKNSLVSEEIDERRYQRHSVETHHTIKVNGSSVRASIVNISRGGMMIEYDDKLDLLDATVKINGTTIDSKIILNEVKKKNYRIVFKELVTEEELNKLITILSHETRHVQEAILLNREYTTSPDKEEEVTDLIKTK